MMFVANNYSDSRIPFDIVPKESPYQDETLKHL